ncbi:MAG: MFS transporter [Lentisphaeria bacterium]|nr:MFS transporter [Lentisphaeria bacterium]
MVYIALFVPFAVTTPYLQKLLSLRGFREDEMGFVLGCIELMAVVAPPLWGMLSDRSGRPRAVLAGCVVGMVPAFLLFGAVRSLPMAVGVAVLFGVLYRPLIPLTDGITFRFLNTHGGDYGKIRIGGSLAFIGTLLLLEPFGLGSRGNGAMILAALAGAGCLQLVSVLVLLPHPDEAPHTHRTRQSVPHSPAAEPALRELLRPAFLWFMACAFLGRFAMMGYYSFFTLYLAEMHGVQKAGLVWLLGPLSEIPVIYLSGRIMNRIGVRNLFALGILGAAVRLLGFSLAPSLAVVIPLQFLHSLTFGAYHCSSVTYVSRIVPQRLQSTAQTLFAAVTVGGGGILGGTAAGLLAHHLGFRAMYGCLGGVAALTLGVLLATVPTLPRQGKTE